MRHNEFWITDHTDNSGFTVETKPDPRSFGSCNYHHVISAEYLGELEDLIKEIQVAFKDNEDMLPIEWSERAKEVLDAR